VKAPSESFETAVLVDALECHWGYAVRELEYLPVGFGAHHWWAATTGNRDLFLAVHDLDLVGRGGSDRTASLRVLERTLSAASWLAAVDRLDFVVGPLRDLSGRVVRQAADHFALSVYPWVDAESFVDPDGRQTGEIIARLHSVTSHVPSGLVDAEDFVIPHRGALEDALAHLHTDWMTGPYAEPAREELLQRASDVQSLMGFYDQLAQRIASELRSDWVITHGEPCGPNLLQAAGGLRLVDWDTALLAPRERDLWELQSTSTGVEAYAAAARTPVDRQRMRLYEAWYALAEIGVYLAVFRAAHIGDANDATSWDNFLMFLPTTERWPELRAF
jgi:spectinomycin phosphotransferase